MQHLAGCIPVVAGALFVFVVVSLLQTSLTDPGILPRATPDEAADVERQIGRRPARWGGRAGPEGLTWWEGLTRWP